MDDATRDVTNNEVTSKEAARIEKQRIKDLIAETHAPSPFKIFWGELKKDKLAMFCLFFFVTVIVTVFVWAATFDVLDVVRPHLRYRNTPPGPGFPLGADPAGRDVLPLLIVGARNSFLIAFVIAILTSVIGVAVGLAAGFYGGHVDNVVMRILDFFTMIPTLMITIMLITLLESTVVNFALVLTIFAWIGMARVIRMVTLQQGVMDYVKASKTLGTRNIVIIFREVVPNIISFMVVNLTLTFAGLIGVELGLTILGFGFSQHIPSIGTLVAYAMDPVSMERRYWQWLPAALFILVMVLCINYVGQALNRAADARRRRM